MDGSLSRGGEGDTTKFAETPLWNLRRIYGALLCQASCACRCFLLSLLHIRRTAFGEIETVKKIAP
jgi:hypothetical protein